MSALEEGELSTTLEKTSSPADAKPVVTKKRHRWASSDEDEPKPSLTKKTKASKSRKRYPDQQPTGATNEDQLVSSARPSPANSVVRADGPDNEEMPSSAPTASDTPVANGGDATPEAANTKKSGRGDVTPAGTPSPVRSQRSPSPVRSEKDASHPPEPSYNPLMSGCRSVDCYARIGKIDEGTYGVVFKAKDKRTGEIVALKQVKMSRDVCREGFPITALRETNILMALKHPNIINVREMVVGSSMDKIFMVMDYGDGDIKGVMEKMKHPFTQAEVKCLMKQLLSAIAFMHEKWYIHRDLKTSNLLYTGAGRLSVCDFGLARKYGDPIRPYTHNVVTLWYRCPELLLGAKEYSTAVDMWSVGCIFAEFLTRSPLFPAKGEIAALDMIFKLLGAPTEEKWPGYQLLPNAANVKWKAQKESKLREKFPLTSFSGGVTLSSAGFDLLRQLLHMDPSQRISAEDALAHEWFEEFPPPKPMELMPTFSAEQR